MKKSILFISLWTVVVFAFAENPQKVEKVHVIFKTHLDVGYTDLASKVEQRYISEFIPKAIAVGEQLQAEGVKDRYVWTTGSWLIDAYLKQASPEAVKKLEDAIRRGDIVWNGVPYTFESEAVTQDLFATTLRLSQRLDKRFGKKTIAAKMTDVPGHTRSIITPLYDAGIRFLQIGVNNQSAVPKVPPVCIWRNTDGKEMILMCQGGYGENMTLPDGKTAVSINFTGDNHGPHTAEQVKSIYAGLRKKYPDAEIFASTLNDVATEISAMSSLLPVVTSEIGDTWIYGYGSSPVMMAKFRALSRLYSEWIKTGKINPKSDIAIDYAIRLGLVAEHTWGLDVTVWLKNWDITDVDIFNASRNRQDFRLMEESWTEKAANIDKAIALLPENLQTEAKAAINGFGTVVAKTITKHNKTKEINKNGAITFEPRNPKPETQNSNKGAKLIAGEVAYQTFSVNDYIVFLKAYCRGKHAIYPNQWFGKPELENTKAQSATIAAQTTNVAVSKAGKDKQIDCLLTFPDHPAIDNRVLPEQVHSQYVIHHDGSVEMTVSLINKPAVRLPEAWWVSFIPEQVVSVIAEKMGERVDVMDVVEGGNRQMHGIDRYVDVVTTKGTIRITSLDAPLIVVGERNALNYSTSLPDLRKGIHFCLFNNLWGTNFTMWWEGNISYRFNIFHVP
ncbi:MAG: DUF5054 domain-containing protein [Bacteroidales bacterium]|jgi:hypothetical protein|nr:DUF5054 domain-containing protein [Bacteroidales bacterium]